MEVTGQVGVAPSEAFGTTLETWVCLRQTLAAPVEGDRDRRQRRRAQRRQVPRKIATMILLLWTGMAFSARTTRSKVGAQRGDMDQCGRRLTETSTHMGRTASMQGLLAVRVEEEAEAEVHLVALRNLVKTILRALGTARILTAHIMLPLAGARAATTARGG